jgi:uncharacterized membrane protein YdjX (TVP38/TMEM64 family)
MNEPPTSTKAAGIKFTFLVLFLVGVAILVKCTGVEAYLTREQINALLNRAGLWAPVAYIFVYITLTLFALPGLPFTIAGALAFGALPATLYVAIGGTVSASGCFFMSRYLGRDFVARLIKGGKLKEFDESIEKNGFKILFIMRLIPIFPFSGINFGAGLSNVRFRDYFFATTIGIIPGTFVYCCLTVAAQKAAGRGWQAFLAGEFLLPLGLFLAMVVFSPLLYKKTRKRKDL